MSRARASFLVLWAALAVSGLLPATVALVAVGGPAAADPFPALEAQAEGRARALDAHIARWTERGTTLAEELGTFLGQLPEGPIGASAEGTLMLHLGRRLARDQEMGEYALLSPGGTVLVSTDGARVGRPGGVEVARAARRPSAVLIRAGGDAARLAVAAPISVGGRLRGVVTMTLRPERAHKLVTPSRQGSVHLVDAQGNALGPALPQVADLGSESRPGLRWLAGAPVAWAPLAESRAVVAVVGRPGVPRFGLRHALGALALLLACTAGAAWLLSRGERLG